MKIRVIHSTGEFGVIELVGAWTTIDGPVMNRINSGNHDHFFTKDGHYDGWGMSIPSGQLRVIAAEKSDTREPN